MSILQINVWVCETCEDIYTTKEEVDPFDDLVVKYSTEEEWAYLGDTEKLSCPKCIQANLSIDDSNSKRDGVEIKGLINVKNSL